MIEVAGLVSAIFVSDRQATLQRLSSAIMIYKAMATELFHSKHFVPEKKYTLLIITKEKIK